MEGSPHIYPSVRSHAPSCGWQLWGAAKQCGVSLTEGCTVPASLRYESVGNHLLGCVPARLSPVVAMGRGDVCHRPGCSPAGLGPLALEYRSRYWPDRSAGLPQCVRPLGCGLLRPVFLLPELRKHVRCPGPLGACSPVRASCAFHVRFPWPPGACSLMYALCAAGVCCWWLRCPPPPLLFSFATA